MTRHPATEGNALKPERVDAQDDVTVPDGNGGRLSFAEAVEGITAEVEASWDDLEDKPETTQSVTGASATETVEFEDKTVEGDQDAWFDIDMGWYQDISFTVESFDGGLTLFSLTFRDEEEDNIELMGNFGIPEEKSISEDEPEHFTFNFDPPYEVGDAIRIAFNADTAFDFELRNVSTTKVGTVPHQHEL